MSQLHTIPPGGLVYCFGNDAITHVFIPSCFSKCVRIPKHKKSFVFYEKSIKISSGGMATRVVATATVRAINRKLQPMRAALTLVCLIDYYLIAFFNVFFLIFRLLRPLIVWKSCWLEKLILWVGCWFWMKKECWLSFCYRSDSR